MKSSAARKNGRVCRCVSFGCGKAILSVDKRVKIPILGRHVSDKEFLAHKRADDKRKLLDGHLSSASPDKVAPASNPHREAAQTSTVIPPVPHIPVPPIPTVPDKPALPNSLPSDDPGRSNSPHHLTLSDFSLADPPDDGLRTIGSSIDGVYLTPKEYKAMRAIGKWQDTFQSERRDDICANGLVFFDSSVEDHSQGSFYLRSDALANTEFIKYESTIFNLLLDIAKMSVPPSCLSAKQGLLDTVDSEWERLVDLKKTELELQRSLRSEVHGMRADADMNIDTESYLASPLDKMHPIIIACYLMIAVLHLVSGLSLNDCRFVLESLRCILQLTFSTFGPLQPRSRNIVDTLPKDARHVLNVLDLSPKAKSYACCPKCYACYPDNGIDSYPDKCTFKATPTSVICGRSLKKTRRIRGIQYSYPARRYLYHDLKHWLGEFLCRPSMEDLLDRDLSQSTDGVMYDIWDGKTLHQILGPDQRPFFTAANSEGRYAFSICIDGFNPFQMKEAGKKVSVGGIYMVCLNLPPDKRYDLENMFLVGIIPGPGEPSCEEINHLLRPLVDDLVVFYTTGVRYSVTSKHKKGRRVRCVLVPVVSDLPATRQIIGFSSFNSLTFCSFCPLSLRDIGNIAYETWGSRSATDYRYWSFKWRDADSETEREKITSKWGVRYSEMLRLPYWDPIVHTTVDSMHVFFQGNLPHHCRVVWGMDVKFDDGDGSTSDPLSYSLKHSLDVQKAFIALRRAPKKELGSFKLATLKLLAQERGLRMVNARRKATYINAFVDYRIRQGWFDAEDNLLKPPRDEELPNPLASADWTSDDPASMELDTAHAYYETAEDPKAFHDLSKPLLVALCRSRISSKWLFSSLTKPDMIQRLIRQRVKDGLVNAQGKLINPDNERFFSARRSNSDRKKSRVLGRERLSAIWHDMEQTTLPSWLSAVPAHIGEAKSGKVTADQWRTFCTVHLVVTLVKLWGICAEAVSSRERLMLSNFMDLITATKLANMRTMTNDRASLFRDYMLRYLTGLKELFPGIPITANLHNTIHLHTILLNFGPSHAWRCWVFERWNYVLQQIQTNKHFGELEITMFQRLCMSQRLRVLVQAAGIKHALQNLTDAFNRVFNSEVRGTRVNDILAFAESQPDSDATFDASRHTDKLDDAEMALLRNHRDAARAASGLAPGTLRNPTRVRQACQKHKKLTDRGVSYSPWSFNPSDSYVIIGNGIADPSWHAARIRSIFTHIQNPYTDQHSPETYFIVEKFQPLSLAQQQHDPYRLFPLAGGRLYRDRMENDLELVTLKEILCHFAHTPFSSTSLPPCIHALPLDRV